MKQSQALAMMLALGNLAESSTGAAKATNGLLEEMEVVRPVFKMNKKRPVKPHQDFMKQIKEKRRAKHEKHPSE